MAKTVTSQDGSVTPFDTLLLATGSSAWMPPIAGLDKDGVFAFRTLDDTRALLERARPGAKAVVIGGGLLGLEAARGLQVQGCDVTVIHLMDTLMERQLDATGGGYLATRMEDARRAAPARADHESDYRIGLRSKPWSSVTEPCIGRRSRGGRCRHSSRTWSLDGRRGST